MFLRVKLPQRRSIKSIGIDTKEVDDELGLIGTKLLKDLVNSVEKYCPFTY